MTVVQELKQLLAIACRKDSRLLVIGVANSITLVEEYAQELNVTVSQPLHASGNLRAHRKFCTHVAHMQMLRLTPHLDWQQVSNTQKVLFHPYSRRQMASILRQQVERLPGPVFEPMALTLCAAKVHQQATAHT